MLKLFYYPTDEEGTAFTGVSLSVHRGVSQSQALFLVSGPRSFPGGTPPAGIGVPPAGTRVPPPPRDRRASTCYAPGGISLEVTQEDFLVP